LNQRASPSRWNGSSSRVTADPSLRRGRREAGTDADTRLYGFAARSRRAVVLRAVASTLRWESSAGKSSFTSRGKIADVLFLLQKLAENQAFCSHPTNNGNGNAHAFVSISRNVKQKRRSKSSGGGI
jgi:hypothetical protein